MLVIKGPGSGSCKLMMPVPITFKGRNVWLNIGIRIVGQLKASTKI